MSCGGILKESEIFNEINNSSNEDSCSEIDNEEVGTTLRRVSPRKREVRCKKTQTGHKKTLESDKTKTKTEETRETGGEVEESTMLQVNIKKPITVQQDKYLDRGSPELKYQEIKTTRSGDREFILSKKKNNTNKRNSDGNYLNNQETVRKHILSGIFGHKTKLNRLETKKYNDDQYLESNKASTSSSIVSDTFRRQDHSSVLPIESQCYSEKTVNGNKGSALKSIHEQNQMNCNSLVLKKQEIVSIHDQKNQCEANQIFFSSDPSSDEKEENYDNFKHTTNSGLRQKNRLIDMSSDEGVLDLNHIGSEIETNGSTKYQRDVIKSYVIENVYRKRNQIRGKVIQGNTRKIVKHITNQFTPLSLEEPGETYKNNSTKKTNDVIDSVRLSKKRSFKTKHNKDDCKESDENKKSTNKSVQKFNLSSQSDYKNTSDEINSVCLSQTRSFETNHKVKDDYEINNSNQDKNSTNTSIHQFNLSGQLNDESAVIKKYACSSPIRILETNHIDKHDFNTCNVIKSKKSINKSKHIFFLSSSSDDESITSNVTKMEDGRKCKSDLIYIDSNKFNSSVDKLDYEDECNSSNINKPKKYTKKLKNKIGLSSQSEDEGCTNHVIDSVRLSKKRSFKRKHNNKDDCKESDSNKDKKSTNKSEQKFNLSSQSDDKNTSDEINSVCPSQTRSFETNHKVKDDYEISNSDQDKNSTNTSIHQFNLSRQLNDESAVIKKYACSSPKRVVETNHIDKHDFNSCNVSKSKKSINKSKHIFFLSSSSDDESINSNVTKMENASKEISIEENHNQDDCKTINSNNIINATIKSKCKFNLSSQSNDYNDGVISAFSSPEGIVETTHYYEKVDSNAGLDNQHNKSTNQSIHQFGLSSRSDDESITNCVTKTASPSKKPILETNDNDKDDCKTSGSNKYKSTAKMSKNKFSSQFDDENLWDIDENDVIKSASPSQRRGFQTNHNNKNGFNTSKVDKHKNSTIKSNHKLRFSSPSVNQSVTIEVIETKSSRNFETNHNVRSNLINSLDESLEQINSDNDNGISNNEKAHDEPSIISDFYRSSSSSEPNLIIKPETSLSRSTDAEIVFNETDLSDWSASNYVHPGNRDVNIDVLNTPKHTYFNSSSSEDTSRSTAEKSKFLYSSPDFSEEGTELKNGHLEIHQPKNSADAISSKKKYLQGRLTRKRKAQTTTSDDTPSKTNRKSQNVNEGEKNKISSKKCVESEDEIDLYNPTTAYSLQRSSAKKNLFTVSDSLTLVNSSGSATPSKQRKNDQNNKENKAQCSNNYKNERTPKKRTSSRVQSFDEFSETESSVKNKLTPVKLAQTPTKQLVGSSSKSERNNRTPRKNLECNLTLKCLEEEVLTNEPSLGIKRLVDLSPSRDNIKSASKPNLDIESEQSSSKTKTPQEAKRLSKELKRLNIDCNNSLFEATSPVRKNRLSLLKTLTPQKHKVIDENTVKTARKGLGKEFEEENENDKCLTPNKKENKLLLGVKDTPQSPSVKCEMKTNIRTPLQRQAVTVTTPVSKKKSGRGFLTPSMAKKEHVKEDKTEDDLDATRKQLHISTVPKSLPCRDAEFDQIKSFLVRKIEHSAGGCMYISGVPGTGKTATVHAVIRYLQQQVDSGDLPDFDFVEVNGLRLTEPKQAYVRILQELTGRKLTPDQAQQLLNKRFSSEQNRPTIVLVDELDYLCNRRQDVVYNILDWPSKRGSALVVLTISNTMDLPERTLKGRVTSRMGLTRVTFQPYGFHQLRTIVEDRLSGTETFHPDAVQLVARKVAAVSGDARRALDICRRTTELVERGEQVTASHVQRALEQIFSGPRVAVIQSLCREGQLVLRAIRDVNQRTGVDEAIGTQVYQHLLEICIVDGCPRPTVGHMLQTCVSLVALGLIVAEKGRPDVTRKMSLNVSSDDIHYALDKVHV